MVRILDFLIILLIYPFTVQLKLSLLTFLIWRDEGSSLQEAGRLKKLLTKLYLPPINLLRFDSVLVLLYIEKGKYAMNLQF